MHNGSRRGGRRKFRGRFHRYQISDTSSDSEPEQDRSPPDLERYSSEYSAKSLDTQHQEDKADQDDLQNEQSECQATQSNPDKIQADEVPEPSIAEEEEDLGEGTSAEAAEVDLKQRENQSTTDLLQSQKKQRSVIPELINFGENADRSTEVEIKGHQ